MLTDLRKMNATTKAN